MKKANHLFQEIEFKVNLMTTHKMTKKGRKAFQKALEKLLSFDSVCTPDVTIAPSVGPIVTKATNHKAIGNWEPFGVMGHNYFVPVKK